MRGMGERPGLLRLNPLTVHGEKGWPYLNYSLCPVSCNRYGDPRALLPLSMEIDSTNDIKIFSFTSNQVIWKVKFKGNLLSVMKYYRTAWTTATYGHTVWSLKGQTEARCHPERFGGQSHTFPLFSLSMGILILVLHINFLLTCLLLCSSFPFV